MDDAEASEDAALRVNGRWPWRTGRAAAPRSGAALVQRVHRLRVRRARPRAVPGRRRPGAAHRVRPHQAGRGAGRARAAWPGRATWSGPPGSTGRTGRSFVATMIRQGTGAAPVEVVDDQYGQPTWTADVADRIARPDHVGRAARHLPRDQFSGETTWFGLAREVFRLRAPTRPGSSPIQQQRAGPPGAAARLQRARPRRLGAGRARRPIGDWRRRLRRAFPGLAADGRRDGARSLAGRAGRTVSGRLAAAHLRARSSGSGP